MEYEPVGAQIKQFNKFHSGLDAFNFEYEHHKTQFRRLIILFNKTEGAWVIAVFSEETTRQRIVTKVEEHLAPLSVYSLLLSNSEPDPLTKIQNLSIFQQEPAPLVCFKWHGMELTHLYTYLELHREALARLPHRLLFWVSKPELYELASNSPNFYSRISGVFNFTDDQNLGTAISDCNEDI